ncbi:hypothetical protein EBU94_07305 [bacterium]|jgi:predicted RNA-binding Zn-ribbon protein involved in translation (DUF1610 family)|nr:hypothetical protein [bacterium]
MNLIESDSKDIITNTVKKSNEKTLNDTTKKWTRNCPKCERELIYKNKNQLRKSIHNHTICKSCSAKCQNIWKHSKNWKIKLKDDGKLWTKLCPRCGDEQSYKSKIILNRAKRKNAVCRECQLRVRKPTYISLVGPNYNPAACQYFDELSVRNNWNLRHALNGGEIEILGYFLDAYDKNKNIVVEYDEPRHYDKLGNLKQKDVLRQKCIMSHLKCKFFRYNEKTKVLYEILS